jgi:hypothetical protein
MISPFIFIRDGLLSKPYRKSCFLALPGDTDAKLTAQSSGMINFEFNKRPTHVDAFITDYVRRHSVSISP